MTMSIIPRAAVAASVRYASNDTIRYILIQRGTQPNRGKWSLPGGKIESGESTIQAVKRELWEETRLGDGNERHDEKDGDTSFIVRWHTFGPFTSTDSIHFSEEEEERQIRFHYVISQCFAQIVPTKASSSSRGQGHNLPRLIASDDAMDAKWWSFDDIRKGIEQGLVPNGVGRVIHRAEEMYQKGLLPCEEE